MAFDDRTDALPPPQEGDGADSRPAAGDVTILVCSSCRDQSGAEARPRPGELLAEAARRANDDAAIRVATVECLGNCKRRLSAALLMNGAWSYVFGDLGVENGADLVEGARLLRTAADGLLPWRGRPDCLKRGLVSRLPPPHLVQPQDPEKAPS